MPLQIIRQDITKMKVDAIVNPTNEKMVGDSGVDLAVHEGAGPLLDEACAKLAPLGLGCVKLTKGYNLPANYIIHTSGPVWKDGLNGESILLKSCYSEALRTAVEQGFQTLAFPLISSGTYGYPKDRVLRFAVEVIRDFLTTHELTVYICICDRTSYEFSQKLYADIQAFMTEPDEQEDAPECESLFLNDEVVCDCKEAPCAPQIIGSVKGKTLYEYMKEMDKPFGYKLFDWIDKRGMTDVECYKKANIDRKTFSKIKSNPGKYRPSKQTAVAFAIALHLDLEETQDLLASAGMTLSRCQTFDKIIRYFIQKKVYDIYVINEALFEFDQVCLGC